MAKPFPLPRPRPLALVGGDTLLGREIQEVLSDRNKRTLITAYSATGEGNFGEQDGEPVYLEPLEAHSIAAHDALIVAGSQEGASKAYNLAEAAGGHPILIDGTAYLETKPEARIVAPLLDDPEEHRGWLLVVAHPAATALALALLRLARHKPVRQALVHIFEPASERGKRGISELHQQTTSLLAFKPLDMLNWDSTCFPGTARTLPDSSPRWSSASNAISPLS